MCSLISEDVLKNRITYDLYKELLDDIYINGTSRIEENEILQNRRLLIYWLTLQEEINYAHKSGRKLSFYRYAEALYSTREDASISIADVLERAKAKKGEKPVELLDINDTPKYYK